MRQLCSLAGHLFSNIFWDDNCRKVSLTIYIYEKWDLLKTAPIKKFRFTDLKVNNNQRQNEHIKRHKMAARVASTQLHANCLRSGKFNCITSYYIMCHDSHKFSFSDKNFINVIFIDIYFYYLTKFNLPV